MTLNTYGYPLVADAEQIGYDNHAFARRLPVDRGCPPRPELFRRIAEYYLPDHFEYHPWTNKVIDTLVEPREADSSKWIILAALPGCSGSAKTFNVASFGVTWWLAAPEESSITFVSTSKGALRKRGWAEISKCFSAVGYGNFIDSRMVWQNEQGDDKHAIVGRAVEEGSVFKVADDIKGVHTRRQMVVIDEATSVPAAIFEACANLYSYPDEFILVLLGNPLLRMDQFGQFCEPGDGWDSVTVDTEEWDGKPQRTMGGAIPRIVRFDAEKCPNLIEDKVVSRHLPSKQKVAAARHNSGGGNSPHYWQNFRGFWPPEGVSNSIFSESFLRTHDAYGKHKFTGRNFQIIGFFDFATGTGGDLPCLRFAKMGETQGGGIGIEAFPPIMLSVDAEQLKTNPPEYQLCEQIIQRCEKIEMDGHLYTCPPGNFGLDNTGTGRGMGIVMSRKWSPHIHWVTFSESASEEPANLEDNRPANDVYENKRAEIYFRAKDAVASGQFKGLDIETAIELCNLLYVNQRPDGTMKKRIVIENKKLYKKRMNGKSPDRADAFVGLIEVARKNGFVLKAMEQTAKVSEDWQKLVDASNEVYANVSYQEQDMRGDEQYERVEEMI